MFRGYNLLNTTLQELSIATARSVEYSFNDRFPVLINFL